MARKPGSSGKQNLPKFKSLLLLLLYVKWIYSILFLQYGTSLGEFSRKLNCVNKYMLNIFTKQIHWSYIHKT